MIRENLAILFSFGRNDILQAMTTNELTILTILTFTTRTEIFLSCFNAVTEYRRLNEIEIWWKDLVIDRVGDGKRISSIG